eukprot:scaffold162_cov275-Pinguiococcus_pyrenoidosus.AAC.5
MIGEGQRLGTSAAGVLRESSRAHQQAGRRVPKQQYLILEDAVHKDRFTYAEHAGRMQRNDSQESGGPGHGGIYHDPRAFGVMRYANGLALSPIRTMYSKINDVVPLPYANSAARSTSPATRKMVGVDGSLTTTGLEKLTEICTVASTPNTVPGVAPMTKTPVTDGTSPSTTRAFWSARRFDAARSADRETSASVVGFVDDLRTAPPSPYANGVSPAASRSATESRASTTYRKSRAVLPLPERYLAARGELAAFTFKTTLPKTVTGLVKPTTMSMTSPTV